MKLPVYEIVYVHFMDDVCQIKGVSYFDRSRYLLKY